MIFFGERYRSDKDKLTKKQINTKQSPLNLFFLHLNIRFKEYFRYK